MKVNSWNSFLAGFEIGERHYIETTLDNYPNLMRTANAPKSRRPSEIKDWEFKTELFTAVSASKAGNIRYLISIERVK
jgi:hypothetical protein